MAPHTEGAPVLPYEAITPQHVLFDLIYNPEETLFLKHGKEHGAQTINGLTMLHAQAEASWKIWNQ
jgi:shikimate dehydrogenase